MPEKLARRLELFKNPEVIKNRLDSTVLSSGLPGTLQADDQSRDKMSAEPAWVCAAFTTPISFSIWVQGSFIYLLTFEAGSHYMAVTVLELAMYGTGWS